MITEIQNGTIIDTSQNINKVDSIYIENKNILAIGKQQEIKADLQVDANNLIVCAGFIDLFTNCREPGQEHIATIKSETTASIAKGITTLVSPPNTSLVLDNKASAELIMTRARQANLARVLPIGALTKKLKGKQLTEMAALKQAGCVGLSNAQMLIKDNNVLINALHYAASIGIPVIFNLADSNYQAGSINDGVYAVSTGLAALPKEHELINLSRYLYLVNKTGVKAHFSHISCRESADLIDQAKQKNKRISADVSLMHIHFTEANTQYFNSYFNVAPPLRTKEDRHSLKQALKDKVIDCVSSGHEPWLYEQKILPFDQAQPGASTIDSFVGITLAISFEQKWDIQTTIDILTKRPANCLGLKCGTLKPKQRADICLIDPYYRYELTENDVLSKGKNTPFISHTHYGKVSKTYKSGICVYKTSD